MRSPGVIAHCRKIGLAVQPLDRSPQRLILPGEHVVPGTLQNYCLYHRPLQRLPYVIFLWWWPGEAPGATLIVREHAVDRVAVPGATRWVYSHGSRGIALPVQLAATATEAGIQTAIPEPAFEQLGDPGHPRGVPALSIDRQARRAAVRPPVMRPVFVTINQICRSSRGGGREELGDLGAELAVHRRIESFQIDEVGGNHVCDEFAPERQRPAVISPGVDDAAQCRRDVGSVTSLPRSGEHQGLGHDANVRRVVLIGEVGSRTVAIRRAFDAVPGGPGHWQCLHFRLGNPDAARGRFTLLFLNRDSFRQIKTDDDKREGGQNYQNFSFGKVHKTLTPPLSQKNS